MQLDSHSKQMKFIEKKSEVIQSLKKNLLDTHLLEFWPNPPVIEVFVTIPLTTSICYSGNVAADLWEFCHDNFD